MADFPGWPNYTVTNANERPRPSSTLQEGDQAPAWSLTSFQERDWTSEETRGQNLLLVIWQEECNNCQRALDEVNNWQVDFEGKDLIIFSMVNNPSQELQDRLLNQPDRIYTHLHLTAETLEAFGPNDYPFFSIIDKEGIVRHLEMGYNQAYVRQWLLDNLE
ncbi:MAG TPA: hypothetical protein DCR93_17115 [Cytophagales bacterium]|nr:hypothetical protein [Cytophagales bacterium]